VILGGLSEVGREWEERLVWDILGQVEIFVVSRDV